MYGDVLTEHVSHADLSEKGEDAVLGDKAIHDRDMEWLALADGETSVLVIEHRECMYCDTGIYAIIVAEVTQPSLGVGYELGRAVAMDKRILCLFRTSSERVLSAMIRGADSQPASSLFQVHDYAEEDVEGILEKYFGELAKT
ncbi:hypothetical protein P4O66_013484 [Electrophorus voltai]|uniref:2'-deoxynucleoside 5'-phosphate N-hydrolase 1 n=1 Tax=Electrophorus voltai TaxID=2609070 RepID=A0AAD8Z522_9TELE|nr:hypothetical protein P4O66_013484 [Electrophorus voltai]